MPTDISFEARIYFRLKLNNQVIPISLCLVVGCSTGAADNNAALVLSTSVDTGTPQTAIYTAVEPIVPTYCSSVTWTNTFTDCFIDGVTATCSTVIAFSGGVTPLVADLVTTTDSGKIITFKVLSTMTTDSAVTFTSAIITLTIVDNTVLCVGLDPNRGLSKYNRVEIGSGRTLA